ncbi:hypothetical protein LIA77_05088 [Sarocladium implicatum]|nr:hypothetical protein LIA77_05088 [Sarocladium implicatum]
MRLAKGEGGARLFVVAVSAGSVVVESEDEISRNDGFVGDRRRRYPYLLTSLGAGVSCRRAQSWSAVVLEGRWSMCFGS